MARHRMRRRRIHADDERLIRPTGAALAPACLARLDGMELIVSERAPMVAPTGTRTLGA